MKCIFRLFIVETPIYSAYQRGISCLCSNLQIRIYDVSRSNKWIEFSTKFRGGGLYLFSMPNFYFFGKNMTLNYIQYCEGRFPCQRQPNVINEDFWLLMVEIIMILLQNQGSISVHFELLSTFKQIFTHLTQNFNEFIGCRS